MSVQRALDLLRTAKFREPLPLPLAVERVLGETGVSFTRARARAGFARGHLLDIVVYLPGGSGASHEQAAAERLVELVLGEELFERWVGSVSATPAVRGGPLTVLNTNDESRTSFPLDALRDAVSAAIAGLHRGLPAIPPPMSTDTEEWVLFELEPEPAIDYAAQDDLVLCSTRAPEQKKSFLRGEPFFSGRFCSSNTLFAYLKYECGEGSVEARLAERSRLEAAITSVLTPNAAALLGLGLGLRYGYLDLALLDPNWFGERACPALRAAGISPRAWLLFCDLELDHEFVPVHAAAPAPYRGGT